MGDTVVCVHRTYTKMMMMMMMMMIILFSGSSDAALRKRFLSSHQQKALQLDSKVQKLPEAASEEVCMSVTIPIPNTNL